MEREEMIVDHAARSHERVRHAVRWIDGGGLLSARGRGCWWNEKNDGGMWKDGSKVTSTGGTRWGLEGRGHSVPSVGLIWVCSGIMGG